MVREVVGILVARNVRLSRLDVVHAGSRSFPMHPKIRAIALSRLLEDLKPLR